MVDGWKSDKPRLISLTNPTASPANKVFVVKERDVMGKTGIAIAKALGMSQVPGPEDDVAIHLISGFPAAKDAELPKKNGGIDVFYITKSPGFKKIGLLRGDEKYNRTLRQKAEDEVAGATGSGGKPADDKAIELLQKQQLIEWWIANRVVLVRVISADRSDREGGKGYFSRLDSIKGKTPKQMEGLLGFKSGSLSSGAKVFSLKPDQLRPRDFEMKGYTHLPGGKPTNFKGKSKEEIEKELKSMKYPPGGGVLQIDVTSAKSVTNLTRTPLRYDQSL